MFVVYLICIFFLLFILLSHISVGYFLLRCVAFLFLCFFFCKQKTAYEMRSSDWSSDVCSSDLIGVNEPTCKSMITSACVTPRLPSDYSILLGSGYRNAAGITDAGAESAAADAWKACRRRHDQRSDGIRGSGPSGCGGSLIPRRRASSNLHFRPAASSRKAVLRKLLPAPVTDRKSTRLNSSH